MEDLTEASLEKAVKDAGGLRAITDTAKKPAGDGVALKSVSHPEAKKAKATKTAKKAKKAPKPVKSKKIRNPVKVGKKPKKAPKPAAKKAKPAAGVVRSERMDLRLTKAEKAAVQAKAKKLRRTLTSLFVEFAEKLR